MTSEKLVQKAVERSQAFDRITEVVSGRARGIDQSGEQWAARRKIPIKKFPADWNKLGKAAGPIRNEQMGQYADAAIVIWDGISTGSRGMYEIMKKLKKPVLLFKVNLLIDADSKATVWYELDTGEKIRECEV